MFPFSLIRICYVFYAIVLVKWSFHFMMILMLTTFPTLLNFLSSCWRKSMRRSLWLFQRSIQFASKDITLVLTYFMLQIWFFLSSVVISEAKVAHFAWVDIEGSIREALRQSASKCSPTLSQFGMYYTAFKMDFSNQGAERQLYRVQKSVKS